MSPTMPPSSRCPSNDLSRPIAPLHAIPYVHGSYASASPLFVRDSTFRRALEQLLPGAYAELSSLMTPDPVKVMKWAENNPVVSAFGIWESDSGRRTIRCPVSDDDGRSFEIRPSHSKPALEWDVFLDPTLVRHVSAAIEVVEGLDGQIQRRRRRVAQNGVPLARGAEDDEEDYDLCQSHTAAQVEVDRLVAQLMKRMILAHGSMSQLVLEAFGVAKDYNYKSVVRGVREATTTSTTTTATGRRNREEEEQDFETLLHPNQRATINGGKETSFVGSRGIFMENWLSIFTRTLLLLKNKDGPEEKTRCNSSRRREQQHQQQRRRRRGVNTAIRIQKQQQQQQQQPAPMDPQGVRGFFHRMCFARKNSNFVISNPTQLSQDQDDSEDDSRDVTYDDTSDRSCSDQANVPSLLDLSPRSNDSEAYNDMFSSPQPSTSSLGALCGMSLCLTGDDSSPTFTRSLPYASHNMSRDIQRISDVLGEPLRLVLDLKSRGVPPKVWSRLIDAMRSRGLVVEGIGSFDMDELRVIAKNCTCPLTPILFFHSVGDLQRACHANEVKKGDTVYFNGGSLMWKPSSIMEAAEQGCCGYIETHNVDDEVDVVSDISINKPDRFNKGRSSGSGKYSFQPYAYPRASLSDWERVMCKSTLECYQKHFNLKIGVYVQEFCISPEALDSLSTFVNAHGALYDQGLAFGGINGFAVRQIHGDGYWNQRYVGRSWDINARPANNMMPLKPEDHHIVQKAINAGAWAQVASTYEVTDEQAGALTLKKREPCNPFLPPGMGF